MEGVEFFMQVQLKQCLKKTVSLNQLDPTANGLLITIKSQGHNFYKLKYISLEEVPFQQ